MYFILSCFNNEKKGKRKSLSIEAYSASFLVAFFVEVFLVVEAFVVVEAFFVVLRGAFFSLVSSTTASLVSSFGAFLEAAFLVAAFLVAFFAGLVSTAFLSLEAITSLPS